MAEGLNCFQAVPRKRLGAIVPETNPCLIVPELRFTASEVTKLLTYVRNGGVAFLNRPGRELRDALALKTAGGFSEGYVAWKGHRTVQFHGEADVYPPQKGLKPAATLKKALKGRNAGLGFFTLTVGQGRIGILPFNLPKSIVLTRQGNPAWKNSKGDDWGGVRYADMFYRLSGERWLDFANTDIPQADFLQRFFIEQIMAVAALPLPKVWYFPNMEKVCFSITADSDDATPDQTRPQTDLVASYNARYTIYLIEKTFGAMDQRTLDYLTRKGTEISLHPDYGEVGNKLKPEVNRMRKLHVAMHSRLRKTFGIKPVTTRNHSAVWCGWADQAKLEEQYGILLDANQVYMPWLGQKEYGGSVVGYMTGSGQPQRFCDEKGDLVNVFQLEQNAEDEVLLPVKGMDLTAAGWFRTLRDLIERSRAGNYSYVGAVWHTLTVVNSRACYLSLDKLLAYCRKQEVPIRTMEEVAEFAVARRDVKFSRFRMSKHGVSFTVSGPKTLEKKGVTLLLPRRGLKKVKVDGRKRSLPLQILDRRHYYCLVLKKLPIQVSMHYVFQF